jgi:hypothetical protein
MTKQEFWKDGESTAKGGISYRCDISQFVKKLIDQGLNPVGIIIDPDNSWNVEFVCEALEDNPQEFKVNERKKEEGERVKTSKTK